MRSWRGCWAARSRKRRDMTAVQIASLTLSFSFLLSGCKPSSLDQGVSVRWSDSEMNQAIGKAQATISRFEMAFYQRQTNELFFLKKPYPTPSGSLEHMWITNNAKSAEGYLGVVNNDAEDTNLVKLGQQVTVQASEASDWYYVKDGTMQGGYTIRYLLKRMKLTERADALLKLPYKISPEDQ